MIIAKEKIIQIFAVVFLLESLLFGFRVIAQLQPGGGIGGTGLGIIQLAYLSVLVFLILGSAAVLVPSVLRENLVRRLERLIDHKYLGTGLFVVSILIAYETSEDILFIQADMAEIHYQGYRLLLREYVGVVAWLLVSSLQLALFWIVYKWKSLKSQLASIIKSWGFAGFLIFSAVIVATSTSNIGEVLSPSVYKGISPLPVPLLGIQVLLFFLGGVGLVLLLDKLPIKRKIFRFLERDWIVCGILILLSFVLWLGVPLSAGSFTDIPRPPNFESYPISDALHYAQSAQRVLVGNGLNSVSHLGYQVLLAFFTFLAGDSPVAIIPLQLAVLSLIPAGLYLVTRGLTNRFSGLVVALLYIVRVRNGQFLSEHITNASVTDFMTEHFGVLGVVVFTGLLISWVNSPDNKGFYPLWAGGILGLTILFRPEMLILLPVVVLVLLLSFRDRLGVWLRSMLFLGLGMVFVVGPIMLTVYVETGSTAVFLLGKGNYLENGPDNFQRSHGPGKDETSGSGLYLFPYHLANNLLQQVYSLPSNHQPLLTVASLPGVLGIERDIEDLEGDGFSERYLERYVRSLPYWWREEWSGTLVPRSYLPVFISLALMMGGYSQIPGRKKTLGAMLLLYILAHSLIYAYIGQSGGRFIQTMYWIPLVFYGTGIAWLLNQAALFITGKSRSDWMLKMDIAEPLNKTKQKGIRGIAWHGALLLGIGLLFPLANKAILPRYSEAVKAEIISRISSQEDSLLAEVERVSSDDLEQVIIVGKVLYPRYFKAGQRMEDDRSGTIPDYSFNRIEFFITGSENVWAAIPDPPEGLSLPNGAEVLVIGIREPQRYGESGEKISGEYLKVKEYYLISP